jgi:two-component system LytT family response regulator
MNPIRCLIVDDERLARQVLRGQLAAHPDFQILAEASNLAEATNAARALRPDIIFLDIQLSGSNGFQLLDALAPDLPYVVFVTAYDQHALRAFDVNALDYLLKPVEPNRLAVTLQRLRKRISLEATSASDPVSAPLLLKEDHVLLSLGKSGYFVSVQDILCITANGKHSVVQLGDGRKVIVRQTMHNWMERLPEEEFVTLDRSCLVQWRRITRADFTRHGATLGFGTATATCELSLGRTAAQRLRQLFTERAR